MQNQKNYRIHYSTQSRIDLDEIWDYIEIELQNPSAARHIVNEIMNAIEQLAYFAKMGAPLSSVIPLESDYRFLVTGNYLTFYRTSDFDVYVDRILNSRQDYLHILFDEMTSDTKE